MYTPYSLHRLYIRYESIWYVEFILIIKVYVHYVDYRIEWKYIYSIFTVDYISILEVDIHYVQ